MKTLKQNVINMLGEQGKLWLASLPNIIKILSEDWNLSQLVPVDNMTYNHVSKAMQNICHPVVLKIGFDLKAITDEKIVYSGLSRTPNPLSAGHSLRISVDTKLVSTLLGQDQALTNQPQTTHFFMSMLS